MSSMELTRLEYFVIISNILYFNVTFNKFELD